MGLSKVQAKAWTYLRCKSKNKSKGKIYGKYAPLSSSPEMVVRLWTLAVVGGHGV